MIAPDNRFKWHASRIDYSRRVQFFAWREASEGGTHLLTNVTVEQVHVAEHVMVPEPTLEFSHEQAQQILDELWRLGYRPNDGEGGNAQVEAIRAHLADMRRLVFVDPDPNGGK